MNLGVKKPSMTRRGRPRKFGEPARPVTMTLPQSVIEGLARYDESPGGAVVKLYRASDSARRASPGVQVLEVSRGTGLILIGPTPSLRKIKFLHLVEVGPARFLLALDPGHDFRELELAIQDMLDEADGMPDSERANVEELARQMRRVRRGSQVRMAEILFVKLDGT